MFYSAQSNKVGSETKREYFLYARRSMDDDDHQQLSIPAQVEELKEFAHKENISLTDILVESKTAKEPGRKVFNSMLSRIESGEAGGILAWHPDRLARNAVDAGQIIHLLDKGLLIDLKFPNFWFQNSSQGIFMLSLAFGQSKYYVDSLSENTKRGLRQKVRNGIYPGTAPVGYINDLRTRTIVIDKEKAPIIKEAFELYSKGTYNQKTLSKFLYESGVKSKRFGHQMKIDRIRYILSNPIYYGNFRYNRELYEGKHTPIISKKLFDQVQEILSKRGWKKDLRKPHALPFAGFIKCGECGMTITAEVQTKYYKTINRRADYIYYRCSKKSRVHKCFQHYIRQELLIPRVNNLIKKFELPKGWDQKLMKLASKDERNESVSLERSKRELQGELAVVNQKIEKLLDAHLDNVITREEYTKKKEVLLSKKKTLEEKLTNLSKHNLVWLEPLKKFIKTLSAVPQIVEDNLNLEPKVEFLKYLGSNLTLKGWKSGWEGRKRVGGAQRRPDNSGNGAARGI